MYANLEKLLNTGILSWAKMFSDKMLTDYSWIGVGLICLPLFRRLVNIFRNLF